MNALIRRSVLLVVGGGAVGLAASSLSGAAWSARLGDDAHSATPPVSRMNLCEHALRMLQEGNQRFVEGKPVHPNTDVFRITDTGEHGQHPFAAIVTCADSRLAVERMFDRGIGDLFVVRVAGNVGDANQSGSVEYACEHLGTQLVVVMGHTRCGAVKAAVEVAATGADAGKNVGSLLDNIVPAVAATRAAHPELSGDALVDAVVRENVWQSIEDMVKGSSALREMIERGQVRMVGAVYDIRTGRVEWLGNHPALAGLLKSGGESIEMGAGGTGKVTGEAKPEEKPAPVKPSAPTAIKPTTKPGATPKPSAPDDDDHDHKPVTTHPH